MPRALLPLLTLLLAAPAGAEVQFRHPLDNAPMDVPLPEGDDRTEAVAEFHRSGENVYLGDAVAVAEGKALYAVWCASCHLPQGTGRIGPSLVDDAWRYPRADSELGRFEIVSFGATGAMQAFGDRLSQDEILKVLAHLDELRRQAGTVGEEKAERQDE